MNTLKRAFKLLDGFSSLAVGERRRRIAEVDRLLKSAEKRRPTALLRLREIDQLRKQRSHMLISAGQCSEGIEEIKSLVGEYLEAITNLHDEAAFQLAEAAIASFRQNNNKAGDGLARSAMLHAGLAKRVNRTVLTAVELVQKSQENTELRKPTGTTL